MGEQIKTTNDKSLKFYKLKLFRVLVFASFLWVGLVLFSVLKLSEHVELTIQKFAITEAKDSVNKDIILRLWVAYHGGVYVPQTEKTPPNPFLEKIPERDIVTPKGKKLTLINPSYMIRQVYELGAEKGLQFGHITSLKPIRPENKADEWEEKVLKKFEKGELEYYSIEKNQNEPQLRYMRVLKTEEACLKCHSDQGYKLGDVRGGISVSIPYTPYMDSVLDDQKKVFMSHILVMIIGLLGIWGAYYFYYRGEKRATKTQIEYENLFTEMNDGFALHEILCDENGKPIDYKFIKVNLAFEKLTGLRSVDVVGKRVLEVMPNTESYWIETYGKVALTGVPVKFEKYSGEINKYYEVKAYQAGKRRFAVLFSDITEKRIQEKERELLRTQLNQSQKIESIGRLAGGVAHDFNNMLGIILGQLELVLLELPQDHVLYSSLKIIESAAKKSSELTKQLLAFARKQIASPKVIDLNKSIELSLKMLRRLIGEEIEILWQPGPDLWSVKFDTIQLDQILTNLCLNARDAIVSNGKIKIETSNISIKNADESLPQYVADGDYVLLQIRDNGKGIETSVLENIFEPFFTTKGMGKGTGLGLATVYGVVKQNQGFINVKSIVGVGTVFEIYLKRTLEAQKDEIPLKSAATKLHDIKTILLVEDEEALLDLCKAIIQKIGYKVIAVQSPKKAVEIIEVEGKTIDLLITDVIMPEMNGKELFQKAQDFNSEIKCLYMSGYSEEVITQKGIVLDESNFLQKPFTGADLREKVYQLLNQ